MAQRSTWILRVAATATTEDVMRIVGEFVRSRPSELWPSLPRNWRPRPMLTTDDVSQYAMALVSAPSGPSTAGEAHYELAGFFCAASQRLAFILSAAVAGKRHSRPRASIAPSQAAQAGAYPCERSVPNSFTSG